MNEDFLHYLWYNRLFYPSGLTTTGNGEEVEIIHPGWPNKNAGPDFFNSRIRIGSTMWAGNVEIHLRSSDWYNHGHQTDEAYNNVVLHVVAINDMKEITDSNKRIIPEIVLRYPDDLLQRYDSLIHHNGILKCHDEVGKLLSIDVYNWMDRMLLERMEQRSQRISTLLDEFNGNWDQVFFVMLARAMGFGINSDPFEMLARSIPVNLLLRHSDNLPQLEAILFGQAGFLENISTTESYPAVLKREYTLLRHKYSLTPINVSQWKLLRLRPVNFPTIRLSQLAAIINKNTGNFESWVNTENFGQFASRLDVAASGYWKSHFLFNKPVATEVKSHLGKTASRLLIINALLPFMFAKAQKRGQPEKCEHILKLFSGFPVEKNNILTNWREAGITAANAGESQALVYLTQKYCLQNKCLQCRIGHLIINSKAKNNDNAISGLR